MPPNDPRAPRLPPNVPAKDAGLRRAMGVAGLALLRWRIAGNFPDLGKFVVIVAPHTSNWDFVVGFAAYLALGLDATWFGKHTIFRWPLGAVFRYFGGIPIVRSRSTNVVEAYIAAFAKRDTMVLAIAPEGTRSRVVEWKKGFYHIGTGAKVPIVPVAFDFASRRIRIFPPFAPTGDMGGDLAFLRSLYDRSMARRPELF